MEIQTQNISSLCHSLLFPVGLDDNACWFLLGILFPTKATHDDDDDDDDEPVFSHQSLAVSSHPRIYIRYHKLIDSLKHGCLH